MKYLNDTEMYKEAILNSKRKPRATGKEIPILDFYSTFEVATWIWYLTGNFPYIIRGSIGNRRYVFEKFIAGYNICLFLISIGVCCLGLVEIVNFAGDNTLYATTLVLRFVTTLISTLNIVIIRVYYNEKFISAFEQFAAQDVFLQDFGCYLKYKLYKRIISCSTWLNTIIDVVLSFHYSWVYSVSDIRVLVFWSLWNVPNMMMSTNINMFINLTMMLGIRFRVLNEKLYSIIARTNASPPKVIFFSKNIGDNVRSVARVHYNLCNLARCINDSFKWNLVVNVINAFTTVTGTLYAVFVEAQKGEEADQGLLIVYVHWIFIQSLPTVLSVLICSWTQNKAARAEKLLYKINVQETDAGLYSAVRIFSMQMRHQKVSFTGAGLLPLDTTLLLSMVGAVTTYLVILIQFYSMTKVYKEGLNRNVQNNTYGNYSRY